MKFQAYLWTVLFALTSCGPQNPAQRGQEPYGDEDGDFFDEANSFQVEIAPLGGGDFTRCRVGQEFVVRVTPRFPRRDYRLSYTFTGMREKDAVEPPSASRQPIRVKDLNTNGRFETILVAYRHQEGCGFSVTAANWEAPYNENRKEISFYSSL